MLVVEGSQQEGCHTGHLINIALILGNCLKLSLQLTATRRVDSTRLLDDDIIIIQAVFLVVLRGRHFQINLGNAVDQGSAVAYQRVHAVAGLVNGDIGHLRQLVHNQIPLVTQIIGISAICLDAGNILVQLYNLSQKAIHSFHTEGDIVIEGVNLLLHLIGCNLQCLGEILPRIDDILTAGIAAGRSGAILPGLIEFLHGILDAGILGIIENGLYLGIVICLAVVVAVGAVFLPILAVRINIPGPDDGSDSGAVAHLAGTCQCINLGGRSCRRMSCLAGISLRVGVADIVTDRIQSQPVCIDTIYHGIESGKGTLHVVSPALKYLSRYAG